MTDITQTNPDLNSFLFTRLAWILSSTSASISTVCSILVIIFISRSKQLSSAYHKIMLFMSSWDVITSLAIALATLPMPADVHDIYPFIGMAFGNTTTCTFQGLSIFTGSMYTVLSNCTLNIYYVCAIRYGMSDEVINRRVLPIMLGISTLFVCMMNILGLSNEYFNPRPYEPFCLVGPYPHNCLEEDNDVDCIRGGDHSSSLKQFFITTVLISGYVSLLVVVSSMVAVVVAVFKTELAWKRQHGQRRNPSRASDFKNTRTALRQALMYIAAFVLTWVWMGIALISPGKPWNDYLKMFFQPLQGFFNAAIFFASKVHILRKAKPALTRWQALVQVLASPWTVPLVVISQIDILDGTNYDGDIEEVDWNDKMKRTGIITTDMPPSSIYSRNNSNNSPSSKDIMAAKESANANAPVIQDGLPQCPNQVHDVKSHADFEVEHNDEDSDPNHHSHQLPLNTNTNKWGSHLFGMRDSKSSCGAEQDYDEETGEQAASERNLSGFSCVEQNDEDGKEVTSKESHQQQHVSLDDDESASISQAGNFGSSFIQSSMNLSNVEDVSLDDSDSDSDCSSNSNIGSCTTEGISFATHHPL